MRRFFLVTCLVAVLLQEGLANPAPQVPIRTKGKHGIPEQDMEKYPSIRSRLCTRSKILGALGQLLCPLAPGPNEEGSNIPSILGLAVSTCSYLYVDLTQLMGRAWSIRAVEPLGKDGQLVGLPPMLKLKLAGSEEKHPGTKAWMETEDILGHFRSPQRGPELDLDSLYHPPVEEVQGEERPQWPVLLPRQVLQGPEEDLDHIHHPAEDSSEP